MHLSAWLIGKFCIAAGNLSLYVYANEVFPTVIRSASVGFFSLMAHLASAFAPIVPTLAAWAMWLPSLTFAVVSLVAALLVWVLPETRSCELPDHPEEMLLSGVGQMLARASEHRLRGHTSARVMPARVLELHVPRVDRIDIGVTSFSPVDTYY